MAETFILKLKEVLQEKRIDADYFREEIIQLISKLEKMGAKRVDEICTIKSGITPQYSPDGNIDVIRSGDLNNKLFINEELLKTTEKELFFLNNNDVLISSIGLGSIGKINIYDENIKRAVVSEITILRNPKVNPYYLFAYLRTKHGQIQINREITGATGQQHLLKSNVAKILVPIISKEQQEKIEKIVKSAKETFLSSKELYEKAEKLILKYLDFPNLDLKYERVYNEKFSETSKNNRIDAEFFRPIYDRTIKAVNKKSELKKLGDIVKIRKGIEVGGEEYLEEGIPFVRVSNLTRLDINDDNIQYISKELFNKLKDKFKPKKEEILLSKDATLGMALLLKEEKDMIISGGILRLRINEDIDKNYLWAILNSLFVKMQIERDAGGSIIIHWRPELIVETLIPILPKEKQKEIGELMIEAHIKREKVKALLEEAKSKVEDLIK